VTECDRVTPRVRIGPQTEIERHDVTDNRKQKAATRGMTSKLMV